MKRSAAWSLGRRLSLWLAIQTIIGLTLVSIGVYFATASALASRQDEALVQKRALVTHLLEEARRDGDLASLTHKLEDFFAGHPELGLELHRQDGSELYRSAHDESDAERVRTVTFSLSSSNGAVGDVTARVSLNPRADDDLLQRLAATLAAAALLGALAASIGGVLLVRLGLTPLQHLVDQTLRLVLRQTSLRHLLQQVRPGRVDLPRRDVHSPADTERRDVVLEVGGHLVVLRADQVQHRRTVRHARGAPRRVRLGIAGRTPGAGLQVKRSMPPVRLLGLAGSLRRASVNRALLRAIAEVLPDDASLTIYDRMGDLPHFNSDLKDDPEELRNLYEEAKHREVREQLQTRLTEWMRSVDDPLTRK